MTSQRRQTLVNVWRLPAKSFETAVVKAITDHLSEHAKRHTVLDNCDVTRLDAAAKAAFDWPILWMPTAANARPL